VVGGGIVGCSVAYHLAALGWTDVVVLEARTLTAGTTWHAAGLVAQVRGTHALTDLARYAAELYERLPGETGVDTGFRRVGALTVARTPERFHEIRSGVSMARDFGIPAEVVEPARLKEHWPPILTEDLVGGVLFPTDGTTNPGFSAMALARGAHDRGIRFVEGCRATGFRLEGGAVTGVLTDRGDVECEAVVIAAGLWSGELARLAGAHVPLHPAEHVWVLTEPAPGAEETLPILRDLDGYFYVRHYRGRYLVGAFEPEGRPRAVAEVPREEGFAEFGPDPDHFAPVLAKARERLPELEVLRFEHHLRAPESFTPDGNFQLGELPEARRLFVAAGFNSQGIIYAPGAGRALAEWIAEGRPTRDLVEVDVLRNARFQSNRRYLHARTVESLGNLYAMHWPTRQPRTARGARRTPLSERLAAAGACFGEAAGWERANWFAPQGEEPVYRHSFGRQHWFPYVGEECRAARESVALFDLSTYSKFLVQGPGAEAALQRICASDVAVEPGRVLYTTWCNDRGGIEMDPTVTRLAEDRYLVVAPTLAQVRTEAWLRRNLPADARATVTDVTSAFAVLAVMGPASRELLSRVADADVSSAAFPFLAAREVDVGWVRAWALRVSYVGELGFELYVPTESAVHLHDVLVEAGADLGVRHAGFHALDALRLERGSRSWGHELGPLDDPYAAGLGFTVAPGKPDGFLGQEALAALRDAPRPRRIVSVLLSDPAPVLWGGESLLRDGARVGFLTSAAFGHTLGASVGLAWVRGEGDVAEGWLRDGTWEVEAAAERFPARVSLRPFFDPAGERLRR
ncbi:MAG TPA: FAD-dependent oxidoreductase, partial [Actinomycetota bacterium]|nr:FAD-dependent oxidoreductase [Actinomycetota bacterium]